MSKVSIFFKDNTKLLLMIATCIFCALILSSCSTEGTGDGHVNKNSISLNTDLNKLELLDKSKISIAIASDYPPFESFKSVQPVGLDIDICYQICHDLNLSLAFNNCEFDKVLMRVSDKNNDIAISGITINEERQKEFDFSIPYFTDTKCAVVLKDSSITEGNIDSYLNDSSKTICYQSGSTSKQYAEKNYPKCQKIEKQTNEDCIRALKNIQADIFIVEKSYFDNKLADEYLNAKNFKWQEKFGIAISKDCPNLKSAIDEIIQARLEDGTIDKMIKAHFK